MYVDFEDWVLEGLEDGSLNADTLRKAVESQVELKHVWSNFCDEADVYLDCKAEIKEVLRRWDNSDAA
ncbi:MAG: hypothetical protein A3F13_02785 [Gammaproteobacteria bacterium RIFCSPHIGHO2_12_FULL_40_19]|nr:MAG: hypothetical protein A3F13_02785 [Gammaproteobacteria bacterium RIFCSPHIGHO2_12_FULL_40_19]